MNAKTTSPIPVDLRTEDPAILALLGALQESAGKFEIPQPSLLAFEQAVAARSSEERQAALTLLLGIAARLRRLAPKRASRAIKSICGLSARLIQQLNRDARRATSDGAAQTAASPSKAGSMRAGQLGIPRKLS
ncbi:MAG: hypothetical protein U1E65_04185 [Myxococcota bacterium]